MSKPGILKCSSILAILLATTSATHGTTFTGIVSDAVNGMLIRDVKVEIGEQSVFTDGNGAFTLDSHTSPLGRTVLSPYKSQVVRTNG